MRSFKEQLWFVFCRFMLCPVCHLDYISPNSPLGKCEDCSRFEVSNWCGHANWKNECQDCKDHGAYGIEDEALRWGLMPQQKLQDIPATRKERCECGLLMYGHDQEEHDYRMDVLALVDALVPDQEDGPACICGTFDKDGAERRCSDHDLRSFIHKDKCDCPQCSDVCPQCQKEYITQDGLCNKCRAELKADHIRASV